MILLLTSSFFLSKVAAVPGAIPFLMSFDLEQMLKSKKAFRDRLAARPIAEKLRMLDALRASALSIRAAKSRQATIVRETSSDYGVDKS
jgi:hypothetical protein